MSKYFPVNKTKPKPETGPSLSSIVLFFLNIVTCTSSFLLAVSFWMDTLLLSVVNHVIYSHQFLDELPTLQRSLTH